MIGLTRPSPSDLERTRAHQSTLPFSYGPPACTRHAPPAGFQLDHHVIELGREPEAWRLAREAIRAWRMFDLGWVELVPSSTPIEPGATVLVLVRALGLTITNAARIVYVVDTPDEYGFAYGTLPNHAERGEERFLVRRDAAGTVTYDLLAHSRPNTWFARLAAPYVRHLQARFARDSLTAMQRATTLHAPRQPH